MNNTRSLAQAFVISISISFALWQFFPAGPGQLSSGFRALVLLPFGAVCPALSGGCLLHDLLRQRSAWAARLLKGAGAFLVLAAIVGIIYLHTQR